MSGVGTGTSCGLPVYRREGEDPLMFGCISKPRLLKRHVTFKFGDGRVCVSKFHFYVKPLLQYTSLDKRSLLSKY